MDKQIMDLTGHGSSTQTKDFIDLMKPQQQQHHHNRHEKEEEEYDDDEARGNGINRDDIVPSYDFQPIRPLSASNYDSAPNLSAAFSRPWNSDSNSNSSPPIVKNYGSLDSVEPAKVIAEKDRNAFSATMLSEIDRTMEKHMENLLRVVEGVSARLTQLETRTHHLENAVDDLKVSVGNNHGSTDGKLRQLENILREVQSGVQTIKDKQDIVQAQLQLAKLQVSKTDQQSETQTTSVIVDPTQQAASASLHSQQQLPAPVNHLPQSIPVVPPPNAPPQPPPQQGMPPPVQHPNQFSQNQIPAAPQRDSYFQPPVQPQETPNQQYQVPLSQQPHPQPAAPPHQQYQQTPHSQYSQPAPHLPQPQPSVSPMNPLPQLQPALPHHVEEPPYVPSQNYPPNLRQPPSQSPTGPPPPPQQFYGTPPPHGYEPPSSRSSTGYSSGYGTLSGPAEPYRYGGPPQYNSALKPQLPTASGTSSGGSGYPQLPTARVLPQAIPTASAVSGGSGSAGTGSRVSIDDVVEKVASMGFPRDHVRATVRKLTENGQSVDLNAVLDKLMNDGEVQPRGGWFGR
ncbi:hypothetical protein RJT34_27725 [Clitoria ternatea]|uniref:DUF1421 domain-containing protein n=1 Tax=Clitoria ternatea TaxID=43366 RepID=A0AAN9F8H0_CLITE